MLIVSPSTATALAPHAASKSWVMFIQANPPSSCAQPGLILIEGAKGRDLAERIKQLSSTNAYEVLLIGLIESPTPGEMARTIGSQFSAHLHDGWFEPTAGLLAYIAHVAQPGLALLLNQTHPGALSEKPVDIDEVAKMLNVSVPTVRRMIAANEIPFLRAGKAYRFVPSDVIASLRRRR
jgi:excisionase family DNA binding protein